jgi:hypothetical protein
MRHCVWFRARLCVAAIAIGSAAACTAGSLPALTQHIEARRLTSELRVQFAKAADASNRAVMADTDEASGVAAREAGQATQDVGRDVDTLEPLLQSLGYRDEIRQLEIFKGRFAEYRKLDADILPLAVENTNIKAQRLSFGPGREAAGLFRQSLDAAAKAGAAKNSCCADAFVARAGAAVLEIEAVEARHIAESDEAAMAKMEAEMAASESAARNAVASLNGLLTPAAGPQLANAAAALDKFMAVNAEIVSLSRRNSNVRSLALSLGRKRTVTAECDDSLRVLDEALATHDFKATR